MRVGRSEALDLFRKWYTEHVWLRCDFSFAGFAACLRGRIVSVSEDQIHLLSDDTWSEVVLPLPAGSEFAYGDTRQFPEDGAFESGLVVFLATRPEEFNIISFLELKEG